MFLFDFLYLCLLSSIFVSLCLSLSIFVFPYLSLSLVALLCLYLSMFILVCLCLLFSIDFSSFLYLSHLCMSLLVSCLPLNLFTSPKYVVAFLFLFISECFLFFISTFLFSSLFLWMCLILLHLILSLVLSIYGSCPICTSICILLTVNL